MIETILSTTYFKVEEKMWLYITRMIIMCGIYLNQCQFIAKISRNFLLHICMLRLEEPNRYMS